MDFTLGIVQEIDALNNKLYIKDYSGRTGDYYWIDIVNPISFQYIPAQGSLVLLVRSTAYEPYRIVKSWTYTESQTDNPLHKYRLLRGKTISGNQIPPLAEGEVQIQSEDGEGYIYLDKAGNVISVDGSFINLFELGISGITTECENIVLNTYSGINVTLSQEKTVTIKRTDENGVEKYKITIDADGNLTAECPKIYLGKDATEQAILGNKFKTYFDAHIHATGVGPSGQPTIPMPGTGNPASTLSDIVKVK